MSNRGRKDAKDAPGEIFRTVLVASLIAGLLACSVALVAAARTLEIGPQVGDILVFRPAAQMPADWEFAAVNEANEMPVSCKLQPAVMASRGGSLVVEQRLDSRRMYRVHWAGGSTSIETTNCGSNADLLISRADLQLLSNVVGGPGVKTGSLPPF